MNFSDKPIHHSSTYNPLPHLEVEELDQKHEVVTNNNKRVENVLVP